MDKKKLCANTACLPNFSRLNAIRKAREMGLCSIELLAFDGARHSQGPLSGFWFNRMSDAGKQGLLEAVRPFDHRAVHLPFFDLPLFSYDEEMRAFCRGQLKVGLDGAAFIGAEAAVVHAYARPGMGCRDYWGDMVNTFRELADYAGERNVRLGVETGFPATVKDFTDLIFDVDRPSFGATIDVGHFRGYGDIGIQPKDYGTAEAVRKYNDTLVRTIQILGAKNFHFHLHDVRAGDWRDHRAPGRGIIDYPRLFSVLRDIGYGGLLSFELEEPDVLDALAQSKAFIERLMEAG